MKELPTVRFPLAMWFLESYDPKSRMGWYSKAYIRTELAWRSKVKMIPRP